MPAFRDVKVALGRVCCTLALCCAVIAPSATAQGLERDVDYRVIPQQPVPAGRQVEVLDFFFYACPYCNALAPELDQWRRNKPADVAFLHVPVVRHDSWAPLAQIFYTLEAMGALDRLHTAVYRAYHVDHIAINEEPAIAEWAEQHGLDRARFLAIYRSQQTRNQVEQARQMTFAYDIDATPSIVVDGRYLTTPAMVGPRLFAVVDALIKLAREQRAGSS
jgi:thiol:disulfide interchange protein DsbA